MPGQGIEKPSGGQSDITTPLAAVAVAGANQVSDPRNGNRDPRVESAIQAREQLTGAFQQLLDEHQDLRERGFHEFPSGFVERNGTVFRVHTTGRLLGAHGGHLTKGVDESTVGVPVSVTDPNDQLLEIKPFLGLRTDMVTSVVPCIELAFYSSEQYGDKTTLSGMSDVIVTGPATQDESPNRKIAKASGLPPSNADPYFEVASFAVTPVVHDGLVTGHNERRTGTVYDTPEEYAALLEQAMATLQQVTGPQA